MPQSLRSKHFIGVAELAQQISQGRSPIVLEVHPEAIADARANLESGHIPGAVFVHLPTQLQGRPSGFSGKRPVPAVQNLQSDARSWGINDDQPIVVYDSVFGTKAGRAWWILRWAGIGDVRILDGGFTAWLAGGNPVSTVESRPAPGTVELETGQLPILDADDAAELAGRGALYDSRGLAQYRAGHIPGARPASTRGNLDEKGLLLPEEALRERFANLGIDGSSPIGLNCGGGVAAAHQLAVLTSLGLPAALFVGSFSAWSSDPSRVVAVGDADAALAAQPRG